MSVFNILFAGQQAIIEIIIKNAATCCITINALINFQYITLISSWGTIQSSTTLLRHPIAQSLPPKQPGPVE